MSRALSEPDAYLRPVGPPPPAKSEPYVHWRESKEERRARLRAIHDLVFAEANIVTFGDQRALWLESVERRKRDEAVRPRCVY